MSDSSDGGAGAELRVARHRRPGAGCSDFIASQPPRASVVAAFWVGGQHPGALSCSGTHRGERAPEVVRVVIEIERQHKAVDDARLNPPRLIQAHHIDQSVVVKSRGQLGLAAVERQPLATSDSAKVQAKPVPEEHAKGQAERRPLRVDGSGAGTSGHRGSTWRLGGRVRSLRRALPMHRQPPCPGAGPDRGDRRTTRSRCLMEEGRVATPGLRPASSLRSYRSALPEGWPSSCR